MPGQAKRMTANPARPVARYRPGKAVAEQESSDEDESEEEQPQQKPAQRRPPPARMQPQRQAPQPESEDEDEEGFVTDEEDEPPDKAKVPASSIAGRTAPPQVAPLKQGSDEFEEESEEDDSEDEEESSEDEVPQRKFQRPTFIRKSDRKDPSATPAPSIQPLATNGMPAPASEPSNEVDTQTRRLAQADLMIKDKLERDALARAQGKKAWDDDDDILPESIVDDADDIDPEAEYAAWKVRELKRLKRDREAMIAREKEIEEIERRRNLTKEEREKEDKDFLDKQRSERDENRTEATYMARYHHKGAFFQGDEAAEILKRRDVMGAKFEDQTDKALLPEYMRIRDMTKLGKKGRTRYTDLKGEDTGRFGDDVRKWRGSGSGPNGPKGEEMRGVDERFLPDDDRHFGSRDGPTGANASIVAPRRDRTGDRSDSHRHRDKSRSRDRRKRSYSASRSRSRSPQRRKRDQSYERVGGRTHNYTASDRVRT
jgi:microfibrillar-associated protein 1